MKGSGRIGFVEKGRWNLKIAIVTTGSWIPFCRVEFRLERNTEK